MEGLVQDQQLTATTHQPRQAVSYSGMMLMVCLAERQGWPWQHWYVAELKKAKHLVA